MRFFKRRNIAGNTKERIFYRSPDPKKPTGGVKVIYDHVDILNKNGFEAYVLHKSKGYRCTWFKNETKVAYAHNITMCERDYLVLPEIYASYYDHNGKGSGSYKIFSKLFSMPAKKVIFNQGCYLTFHSHPINKDRVKSIYLDPSVISTMVVSEDSRRYLEYAFPGIRVCCIHNSINTKLFSYQAHKKPQLCFMPKKNLQDITQIINILKFRGALDGFDIISIENMHESDVARIFRESLIFLSLSYQEGFALPPAEAMACGCVVIGYHGGGGKEYFSPDFCYPVETGNVIQFCQTIEEVIKLYNKNREVLVNKGRLASVYITENYARQKQEYDVLNFWKTTIGQGDNL